MTAALASMLGDQAAVGLILTGGKDKQEALINAGLNFGPNQRIVLTVGQLKQYLDFSFRSGVENVGLTQNAGALSYQFQLGQEFLRYLELNGYLAETESRQLAGKTFAVDTATLYELWNDPRRVAGGKVSGVQGRIGFSPVSGALVKVSVGQERLRYDLAGGQDLVDRLTGGIEWQQQLGSGYQLTASADAYAAERRYSLGLERANGPHRFGLGYGLMSGRDGLADDYQIRLSYSYLFGASASSRGVFLPSADALQRQATQTPQSAHLLTQVITRPTVLPSRVIARVDETATPVRLIAVDKTALPAGSSINTATGAVTTPLGVVVTGIAGVTLNAAPFVNSGQFALSGNSLVIDTNQITQPAAGVTDNYVVTINNFGGGTTLVTVNVSRGSVRIDSIVVSNGLQAEVPPVMGDVPNQTATAGSVFSLNVSPSVTLTNGDAVSAYTLSGTLPTGLSFNNTTGVISGTPTQTGSFNLSITATDNDGISNSDAFTLTVSAAEVPPVMGDVPNQTATAGSAFSLNVSPAVTLTNGDAVSSYTLTGTLPTGLSFNNTTGVLSGTPTQTGSFNLSVTATDNDGVSNSDAFTLTVSAAQVPPIMGDVPNQSATAGSAFSLHVSPAVTLTNLDAVSSYTLTGTLPTGLSFNIGTGVLSGTPTQTGSFNLSVTATDNDGVSNSDAFTLVVSAVPDTTPNAFDLIDQTNVALGSTVTSAGIVVSGINTAAPISITNGQYSINGGTFTSSAGTVNNGDTVVVRHTASALNSTSVTTVLNISGVTDSFASTTVPNLPPTGQDIVINAGAQASLVLDLTPYLSDPENDPITATLVSFTTVLGDLVIPGATIVGNVLTIGPVDGSGHGAVEYTLNDNPTVYTIQVNNLAM